MPDILVVGSINADLVVRAHVADKSRGGEVYLVGTTLAVTHRSMTTVKVAQTL